MHVQLHMHLRYTNTQILYIKQQLHYRDSPAFNLVKQHKCKKKLRTPLLHLDVHKLPWCPLRIQLKRLLN